jgi:hypothetical protein
VPKIAERRRNNEEESRSRETPFRNKPSDPAKYSAGLKNIDGNSLSQRLFPAPE